MFGQVFHNLVDGVANECSFRVSSIVVEIVRCLWAGNGTSDEWIKETIESNKWLLLAESQLSKRNERT